MLYPKEGYMTRKNRRCISGIISCLSFVLEVEAVGLASVVF